MKSLTTFVSALLFAGSLVAGVLPGGEKPDLPGTGDSSGPVLPPGGGVTLPGGGSGGGNVLPSPPPVSGGGDLFVSATRLSGPSVSDTGSNSAATKETGEPNHGGYDGNLGGKSMWWRWTSTTDGMLTVSTAGSSFDTVVAVYAGNSVSALTNLGHDDNGGPGQTSKLTVRVFPDTVYYIAVDGYNGANGSIELSLSVAPIELSSNGRPVNDDFENSIELAGGFTTIYGTNQNATVQSGEESLSPSPILVGQSVWYSWTAPSTGKVTIDTVGSNYDTSLTIYLGDTYDDLEYIEQDDDGAATNLDSMVELDVLAGTTLRIAVDGWEGFIIDRATGRFTLNIKQTPIEEFLPPLIDPDFLFIDSDFPINDTFDFRTGIQGTSYSDESASNVDAYNYESYLGEPVHGVTAGERSVWWTWTAPAQVGTLTLKAVQRDDEDNDISPVILVYNGASVSELTLVDSAAGVVAGGISTAQLSITTTPGMTYQIAVTGESATSEGEFSFNLNYADGKPAFESQPTSASTVVGEDVDFIAPKTSTTLAPSIHQWQRKVGSTWTNLVNDATFSGVSTDTLTVNNVTLAHTDSLFRCMLYNVIGTATSSEVKLTVLPNPPANLGPSLNIKTGSVVNTTVASSNPGLTIKYYATGLPKGLKINASTGQITGTVTASAGSYVVRYWTQSGKVQSAVRTTIIVVPSFPAALTGDFEALLVDGSGLPVGKLQVTVSAPGTYTGKLTSAAAAVSAVKGKVVLSGDDASATASVSVKRKGFATSVLNFTVRATGTIDATLVAGATIGTAVDGVKVATTSIDWAGTYTLAFGAPVPVNVEGRPIPAGSGYAAIKVASNGVMTLTGKNADGTPLTASLSSATDASYRLYAKPSTVVGSYLAGWINLTERAGEPGVYHGDEADNGDLYWALGASTKSAAYREGFGPLMLAARVEPWENLFAPFQIDPTDDDMDPLDDWDGIFGVGIDGAGITNGGGNTNNLPESLQILVGGTIGLTTPNLSGWSISVNTATGVFTGSFTVTDTLTRKVPFSGILLQLASDDTTGLFGQGHFLLPSTVKKGPALSGAIEFVAPEAP